MTWLTAELPGTGGRYKVSPEHFQVEEIPLYPCSGSGEHLYLWVQKRGITTGELVHQLARGLELSERRIGYAGLKDARALTRQMVSIPATAEARLNGLRLKQAEILSSERHSNKLRLGHLRGNRFRIRLQNTRPRPADRAAAILEQLGRRGVPNRFGEQRYGVLGHSADLGRMLLQGDFTLFCTALLGDPESIRDPSWQAAVQAFRSGDLQRAGRLLPSRMRDERRLLQHLQQGQSPRAAALKLPRRLLRLLLSAFQSQLFDTLLDNRIPRLNCLEDGDIAVKHDNGACFRVLCADQEQQRCDSFAISPTAPLFGSKVMLAEQIPGQRERELLQSFALTTESWLLGHGLTMPGERRPLRVPLNAVRISEPAPSELDLSFSLPRGSYATAVLAEISKTAEPDAVSGG